MLRTSEVESRATRASLTELLSPQMGKDIVWFLRRWAKTYLLVDEKLYEQVCVSLHMGPPRGHTFHKQLWTNKDDVRSLTRTFSGIVCLIKALTAVIRLLPPHKNKPHSSPSCLRSASPSAQRLVPIPRAPSGLLDTCWRR